MNTQTTLSTSSTTSAIARIKQTVARLNMPGAYVFRQVFSEEQRRIAKEKVRLEQARVQIKDEGFAAAARVLLHEEGYRQRPTQAQGTYLQRHQSRD